MMKNNLIRMLINLMTLFSALCVYMFAIEPRRFEFLEVETDLDRVAQGKRPLAVLHLSDLHLRGQSRLERNKIEQTVNRLAGQEYDLLMLTGDMIHHDSGIDALITFLGRIPQPRYGAYACLGNHDYAQYDLFKWIALARDENPNAPLRAMGQRLYQFIHAVVTNQRVSTSIGQNDVEQIERRLSAAGVNLLTNRSMQVDCGDDDALCIVGLDDFSYGAPDPNVAFEAVPDDNLTILLAHHPAQLLEPDAQQADLALAGHVHGGQIRFPYLGAFFTQGGKLPRKRAFGWFRYGSMPAYVSRGWGEGIPLRFNCRPEMTLIKLR